MTGEIVSRIIVHGFILLRLTDDDWEVASRIIECGFIMLWLTDDDWGSSIQNYRTRFYVISVA